LAEARPGKVVCLSTIGADAPHENLLTQRTLMEQSLKEIGLPVTFLRPGWFMENALWDVPSARDEGVLRSFLQPADRAETQAGGRCGSEMEGAETGRKISGWQEIRGAGAEQMGLRVRWRHGGRQVAPARSSRRQGRQSRRDGMPKQEEHRLMRPALSVAT
jgi:hypothetical protein